MTELEKAHEALRRVKYEAKSLADAQVIALEALTQALATTAPRTRLTADITDPTVQARLAEKFGATVEPLAGCNCRWQGETQVEWCELHIAHKEAIHAWAERAKAAEAKSAPTTERKLVATPDHNGAAIPASPSDMRVYDKIAAGYWTERKGEPVAWVLTHQLERRETTTRGYLWFSDPKNDSWTPIYTSPQVPEDVMSVLSAIHRRPSDAGIWLDDLTRVIRAARKGE